MVVNHDINVPISLSMISDQMNYHNKQWIKHYQIKYQLIIIL